MEILLLALSALHRCVHKTLSNSYGRAPIASVSLKLGISLKFHSDLIPLLFFSWFCFTFLNLVYRPSVGLDQHFPTLLLSAHIALQFPSDMCVYIYVISSYLYMYFST